MKEIYIHDEETHNVRDPKIIIPVLIDLLGPKSIIDIGCGIGTFLKIFKELGVRKVVGLDGSWVDKNLLFKNLDKKEFIELDLLEGFRIESRFDLAICLEVAEHLPESYAELFIKSLVECSDTILFSAAIPGQTGQNHINEQWPHYWNKMFQKFNYSFYDVIRPIFWENKNLSIWYRQNMFLVVRNGKEHIIKVFENYIDNKVIDIVHPTYYLGKVEEIERLQRALSFNQNNTEQLYKGKSSFLTYSKMITKFFLRKLKLYNK